MDKYGKPLTPAQKKKACEATKRHALKVGKEEMARRRKLTYEKTQLFYRKRQLQRLYGLTVEQYDELDRFQESKCAICGNLSTTPHNKSKKIRRLSVDHDHKTGRVRQLLCMNCNIGIGKFNDDPALMKKALDYLTKWESLN